MAIASREFGLFSGPLLLLRIYFYLIEPFGDLSVVSLEIVGSLVFFFVSSDLDQWLSNMAAHWNFPGSFKSVMPGSHPQSFL